MAYQVWWCESSFNASGTHDSHITIEYGARQEIKARFQAEGKTIIDISVYDAEAIERIRNRY